MEANFSNQGLHARLFLCKLKKEVKGESRPRCES